MRDYDQIDRDLAYLLSVTPTSMSNFKTQANILPLDLRGVLNETFLFNYFRIYGGHHSTNPCLSKIANLDRIGPTHPQMIFRSSRVTPGQHRTKSCQPTHI